MKYLTLVLGFLSIIACKDGAKEAKGIKIEKQHAAIITRFSTDASSIFTNAFIIELDKSTVVVDATLTVSSSKKLRAKVDSIGKPLAAVFITHGHPDHYNGLGYITEGISTKIYSTQEVYNVIAESDKKKEEQWVPMFGDEWPKNRVFPNAIVASNKKVTIDGVEFSITSIGAGESHADSYITMQNANKKVAFVGDVVLHNFHAYLSDGHVDEWLSNLNQLKTDLKQYTKIYPGHGSSGGLELLSWQENYLVKYIQEVKNLLGSQTALSDEDKKKLSKIMKPLIPDDKLMFLVPLGADAVAEQIVNKKL